MSDPRKTIEGRIGEAITWSISLLGSDGNVVLIGPKNSPCAYLAMTIGEEQLTAYIAMANVNRVKELIDGLIPHGELKEAVRERNELQAKLDNATQPVPFSAAEWKSLSDEVQSIRNTISKSKECCFEGQDVHGGLTTIERKIDKLASILLRCKESQEVAF